MTEMCTCKTCGVEFPRRSPRGPKPTLCDEHRDVKRYVTTGKGRPLNKTEEAAEEARVAARLYEEEPTWLDDPEVQEQLAERQRAALGLDASASAADVIAEMEKSPVPECSTVGCTTIPLYPDIEPKFCLHHWLNINHDLRGVMLGSLPGSAPWNSALVKAIRSLR